MGEHQKDSPAPVKQRSELSLVIRPSDAAKHGGKRRSSASAKDHDHKGHSDERRHSSGRRDSKHKHKKDHKHEKDHKHDKDHKHEKDHKDHKDHHRDYDDYDDDDDHHLKSESQEKRKSEGGGSGLKCTVIGEYSEILENIVQQNENMNKLKEDIMKTSDPKKRKGLEMIYNAEEEKLNEEIVKAMVLQSKCPYEKWPPIPIITNLNEDSFGCNAQDLLNRARRQTSVETKNSPICRMKHDL